MLHRRGAIAQERQQVREPFLHGKPLAVVAAGLLQHLEGAPIVLHRFFGRIQRMAASPAAISAASGSGGSARRPARYR